MYCTYHLVHYSAIISNRRLNYVSMLPFTGSIPEAEGYFVYRYSHCSTRTASNIYNIICYKLNMAFVLNILVLIYAIESVLVIAAYDIFIFGCVWLVLGYVLYRALCTISYSFAYAFVASSFSSSLVCLLSIIYERAIFLSRYLVQSLSMCNALLCLCTIFFVKLVYGVAVASANTITWISIC